MKYNKFKKKGFVNREFIKGKVIVSERTLRDKPRFNLENIQEINYPICSACIITWNEEDLLYYCLEYLESIPQIGEICIVDSFSYDNTINIIEDFKKTSKKIFKVIQNNFSNFSDQRNLSSDLATHEWILYIDADETYTFEMKKLLSCLPLMPTINAIRINTITMFQDRLHYIKSNNYDPHIRIWRKGFAKFFSEVHESLIDSNNRHLHSCKDPDILEAYELFPNVIMKHHQLLKSEKSLLEKGERWEKINAIQGSSERGIVINKKTWFDWKNGTYDIAELPTNWYDVTTTSK